MPTITFYWIYRYKTPLLLPPVEQKQQQKWFFR